MIDNDRKMQYQKNAEDSTRDFVVEKHIKNDICCSFCGQTVKHVQLMIEGNGVYICNYCVDYSYGIVHQKRSWWRK